MTYVLLGLLGIAVGTFGTLVGAGGGFILTPLLLIIYPGLPAATITSISLLVVFSDYTLAIEDDYMRFDRDERQIAATVGVFDPSGQLGSYETRIDTGYLDWRRLIRSS